jgi:hypothetical protein
MSNTVFEDKIKATLNGDTLKNALDFVAFLQANEGLLAEPCEGTDGWNIYVKGINSAFVNFSGENNNFDIVLHINTYDGEEPVDDDLKEFAWAHVLICPKGCGSSTLCGNSKINNKIFEKEYERICQSPLYFPNPYGNEIKMVQKLLLLFH